MSLSLRSLSDEDVLSRTRALTVQERATVLSLILHLNEIERRRLHLKQGYRSMFDYCTSGLGYSASAAMRRIRTARCVARFPEVYPLLEANEVSLSTVAQVSRILTAANCGQVLGRIRGKSQREVEAIVAEYEPRAALPPDRVRTVVVLAPAPAALEDAVAGDTASQAHQLAQRGAQSESQPAPATDADANHNRSGCDWGFSRSTQDATPVVPESGGTESEAVRVKRAVIQFTASEAFMAKLEQVRALAWHRLSANASLEDVFALALDLFIERNDPCARHERRKEREQQAPATVDATPQRAAGVNPRHVPASARDEVYARDRAQCTYTAPGGRRCGSTRGLQLDHVIPVARGGPGTADNLRLLCAHHNRLEAERLMGSRACRRGP